MYVNHVCHSTSRHTCCPVVSKLLVNQYSVRPEGTLSEKYPATNSDTAFNCVLAVALTQSTLAMTALELFAAHTPSATTEYALPADVLGIVCSMTTRDYSCHNPLYCFKTFHDPQHSMHEGRGCLTNHEWQKLENGVGLLSRLILTWWLQNLLSNEL